MARKKKKHESFSFKQLIAGDILTVPFLRRQMGLIVLIVILTLFYEGNRYGGQWEQVNIQRKRKELLDVRNEAVALHNELLLRSRQTVIEERIKESQLHPATKAPIVIN